MKRTALFLALLLLVPLAQGAFLELGTFSIENPRVLLTYTKEVTLISMDITSIDTSNPASYTLVQETPAPIPDRDVYAEEFVLITEQSSEVQPLTPGTYRVSIRAKDRNGAVTDDTIEFVVAGLDIVLLEPSFGLSASHPFSVLLVTLADDAPAEARCEHSPLSFDDGLTLISSGFQTEHLIPDVNYRGSLYVVCEERTGRVTMRRFTLDWDDTPPRITPSANPGLVRDPRHKSTVITIETDDDTVCTLDGEPFAEADPRDRASYAAYHEARQTYAHINDGQEHVVEHSISCTNLAGLTSAEMLNVTVNFGLFTEITVLSPSPVANLSDFELAVLPSFAADSCTVDGSAMDRQGETFSRSYTNRQDGTYTFSIRCTGSEDVTRLYNVTIDTLAPSVEINASQIVCLARVTASWSSDSDTLGYAYTVRDEQRIISQAETLQDGATVALARPIVGSLEWIVSATDRAGNTGTYQTTVTTLREGEEEECGLPPFIQLVQPPLGFALTLPYTVQFSTQRQASCRYALQPGVPWSSRSPLQSSDGLLHGRQFDFDDQHLYVLCQEPNLKNHTKAFRIGIDSTPPTVSVAAAPNPVVDPAHKIVVMTVTTNDPTHCTYNGEPFDGNIADGASYTDEHAAALDFRDVTGTDPLTRPYEIFCQNLAQLRATKNYAIQIDLAASLTIDRVSPSEFTADNTITLGIRPNVEAACLWKEANASGPLQPFDSALNNTHTVALGSLSDGSHHYLVDCTGIADRGSAVVSFTVDREPPKLSDLAGPAVLCGVGAYTYNISGLDQQPTVVYAIEGTNGTALAANTRDAFLEIDGTQLDPGVYTLSLTPVSKAGIEGISQTLTVDVTAPDDPSCSPGLCQNGVQDIGESGVDCGGVCATACLSCISDGECPITMSCELGICVDLPIVSGTVPIDEVPGAVDEPPLSAEPNSCSTNFECSLDEVCSGGRCVPEQSGRPPPRDDTTLPPPESGGIDWMALTLIILGLLVMGGSGYYLYDQNESKQFPPPGGQSPQPPLQPRRPAMQERQAPPRRPVQQERTEENARARMLEEMSKHRAERTAERHAAFDSFGGTPPQPERTPKRAPEAQPAEGKQQPKKKTSQPEKEDAVFDELEKL